MFSPHYQIEQSFHRFKKRLHVASVRWVELKTGVVARNHSVHVSFNAIFPISSLQCATNTLAAQSIVFANPNTPNIGLL